MHFALQKSSVPQAPRAKLALQQGEGSSVPQHHHPCLTPAPPRPSPCPRSGPQCSQCSQGLCLCSRTLHTKDLADRLTGLDPQAVCAPEGGSRQALWISQMTLDSEFLAKKIKAKGSNREREAERP